MQGLCDVQHVIWLKIAVIQKSESREHTKNWNAPWGQGAGEAGAGV